MAGKNIPVYVGERLDNVLVNSEGDSDGIVFIDGYVIFVPDVAPGQKISIIIKSVGASFARAEKVR